MAVDSGCRSTTTSAYPAIIITESTIKFIKFWDPIIDY